jgi:hypothetical protein
MLNTQELRLGNYVNVPREDQSPFRIDGFEFLTKDFCKVEMVFNPNFHPLTWELKDLQPIPLTPDILVKAAALVNKVSFTYRIDLPGIQMLFLDLAGVGTTSYYVNIFQQGVSITLGKVQYLHQVQNLFFALTGTELTLSL